MKTGVSIPEDVFRRADRLARRLKVSRSQLYADAVREFVVKHDHSKMIERINAVCDKVDTRPDAFMQAAARAVFRRAESGVRRNEVAAAPPGARDARRRKRVAEW